MMDLSGAYKVRRGGGAVEVGRMVVRKEAEDRIRDKAVNVT